MLDLIRIFQIGVLVGLFPECFIFSRAYRKGIGIVLLCVVDIGFQ